MSVVIDNITIVLGIVMVVLFVVAMLTDVFLRRPVVNENPRIGDAGEALSEDEDNATETQSVGAEDGAEELPPVSIIITPHDNAMELEQNLPAFLEQDYPAPFKVIVVFWKGESDTDDVLKKYASNPHLYSTYIPESSRYMSRKKLAITVGEKAAETEWLLITDITCRPQSNQWLRAMARHAGKEVNLVLGHTRYDDDTPSFRRFVRSYASLYLMHEMHRGTAYRCEGNALMFRRSEFERQDGFRSNLKYLRGEYDFIVNDYARRDKDSAIIENSPEGVLVEQCPTDKEWRNKQLYYLEDRRHMLRSAAHRWRHNVGQVALHASFLTMLLSLAYGIMTQRWVLVALAGCLILSTVLLRSWLGHRALACLGEALPTWRIFPYELWLLWHNFGFKIRYWRSNKDDFITHKI